MTRKTAITLTLTHLLAAGIGIGATLVVWYWVI